jgi:ferric-dicitrate binding protein FerR (iron transport regulator)
MKVEEWTGYEVSEEVLKQAANWIAVLDSNTLESEQQQEFLSWLQLYPSHQQAYIELSELWAKSSCIQRMSDMIERSSVIDFPSPAHHMQSDSPKSELAGAPAWVSMVTIGLIFLGLSLPILGHFF